MREVFDAEPDLWQAKALRAFANKDHRIMRIALSACAGPGKSAILAICAWNFLLCYGDKGHHPKGFCLSISADNLATNLWPELSKWQSRSKLLTEYFTWTKTMIYCNDHPETWFLKARSYSKDSNAEEQGRSLSGLHSDYVAVFLDEIGDMNPIISRTIEQAFGGCKWGRVVAAGNPTSKNGLLYEIVTKLRDKWEVIRITGDPDDPERSPRIDIDWAREQINLYGRSNPWVQAYILGLFSDTSLNNLLSIEEVESAIKRKYSPSQFEFSQKRLGVDVARFGLDSSVIFPRQGIQAFNPVEMSGARGNEVAARVVAAKLKWGSELEFVDGTGGFGGGVVDSMAQAGYTANEIHFSGKPINEKYFNKRSEIWFLMSEWVKKGGALPDNKKLVGDLVTPMYSFNNGKFFLESKDQIKKRLGRSVDFGDALALTFSLPEMPAKTDLQKFREKHGGNNFASEFDPFRE